MSATTYLIDIPAEECASLLAGATLGRLGVVVDGRPEIYPVNHVYDHERGCVAFPTNPRTKLHAALTWPSVAFEVDGIRPDGGGGWSVLVVGHAEEISDAEEIDRLAAQRTVLWRAGATVHWVRIVPTSVTGRRIYASDQGFTIRIT
jgi:nitroimidazol reductase NimA-like FMN-containing flavoprotein (pyridoxamine 5'-phosphate oxidase superfamily)